MSKRMRVLVSVLVAVLLLVVGGTAMVMAQEEEEPMPQAEANGLLAKVAGILDIPEEDLVNAFKQARQEMKQEAFFQFLDEAVAEGLITQDEADGIREWWEQRPEFLDRGLLRRAFDFMGPRGKHMPGGREMRPEMGQQPWQGPNPQAWQSMRPGAFNPVLDRALEKEHLTLEPEASNRPYPRARIFKAIRGRQMISVPRGQGGPGLPEPLD